MTMQRLAAWLLVCACVTMAWNLQIQAEQAEGWRANEKLVQEQTARRSQTIYDEAKVPLYTLPDP